MNFIGKIIKFMFKIIGIDVFYIKNSEQLIEMLEDCSFGMCRLDSTINGGTKQYDIYRMFEFTTLSTGEKGMVYTRTVMDNFTGNEMIEEYELAEYCFDFYGWLFINHRTISSHLLFYFDLYDSVNYGHIDYKCSNFCTIYTYDINRTGHGILTKRFLGKEEDGNGIKV